MTGPLLYIVDGYFSSIVGPLNFNRTLLRIFLDTNSVVSALLSNANDGNGWCIVLQEESPASLQNQLSGNGIGQCRCALQCYFLLHMLW